MNFLRAGMVAAVLGFPLHAQLAPHNENGLTFGHVHLNVRDIEAHTKLYVEQFGGVVAKKGPLTVYKLPNMIIAFTQKAPTGSSEGTVLDHFGFKVKDLAVQLAKWRKTGFTITREFIGSEGFPNAYVKGPDDVRIELQEDKTLTQDVMGYHVHYLTPEYLPLRDWYADVFALPTRPRGRNLYTTQAPGQNMTFANSQAPTVGTKGRGIDHIGFEIRNLEAFCKKLEARGIKFDVPYRERPDIGLKLAFLTDPQGVYIELTEGYNEF